MQIENIPIESLVTDPSNARKHPTKNLEAIKGSLAKFGQQKPIVIDRNKVVIAGNGTLEAAKLLGWSHLDCVSSELEGSSAVAFGIADNRTSELADWDEEVLAKHLEALKSSDFNLGEIGFDDSDLTDLLAGLESSGELDIDAIEGAVTMSDELDIDKEYMVVMFDSLEELAKANTLLGRAVETNYWLSKYKKNPDQFFRPGPNRVCDGSLLIEKLGEK